MTTQWASECCDRYDDPVSGARVIQLTSGAVTSNNIYCEQPYTSPDGTRVAIVRKRDFNFDQDGMLLVGDLTRLRVGLIEAEGVKGVCNAAWSGKLVYAKCDGKLHRVDLQTLEKETLGVFGGDSVVRNGGSSVSPDQRYIVAADFSNEKVVKIVRGDLEKGTSEVIFEHPDIRNPHLQFNPVTGEDILVQHNRGSSSGSMVTEKGTTLFVIDKDGNNMRELPVGPPITASATGHECFVADTGKVCFTVGWNHHDWSLDERYPQGNLFVARPGDSEPTVIETPDHRFNHVCVSRCGKYFVADSYHRGGLFGKDGKIASVALVVGNLNTGKHRVLVDDTLASGGGNQSTHTHPYLTADNGHVIYNSDPYYSTPQVFAAKIPDGFLESLD